MQRDLSKTRLTDSYFQFVATPAERDQVTTDTQDGSDGTDGTDSSKIWRLSQICQVKQNDSWFKIYRGDMICKEYMPAIKKQTQNGK